jgi:hypothetical protein
MGVKESEWEDMDLNPSGKISVTGYSGQKLVFGLSRRRRIS